MMAISKRHWCVAYFAHISTHFTLYQISRPHSNLVAATGDVGIALSHRALVLSWLAGVGDDGGVAEDVQGKKTQAALRAFLCYHLDHGVVRLFVRKLPNNFAFLVFFIELCFAFFIIVVTNCEQRCKAIKILH